MAYAITATAHPAPADRSWDEQIVPALRMRLESESRAISKRMSAASFGSADETIQYTTARPTTGGSKKGGRTTPSSANSGRPSAIPRPSLNYTRPSNDGARRAMPTRKRTLSTPFVVDAEDIHIEDDDGYDDDNDNDGGVLDLNDPPVTRLTNALPTPASSRSGSPVPPHAFSNTHKAFDASINYASSTRTDMPITSTPKRHVHEPWNTKSFASSGSSVEIATARPAMHNVIMQEHPPFTANSSYVSEAEYEPDRPSAEEERPFEHWYRGDLSRNGGVGELRVGNRKEMLEIANYGHKIKHLANGSVARRRRRTEEIGNRESALLEDYEMERRPMVLDETPLTDMEADTELETDREISYAREFRRQAEQAPVPSSAAALAKSANSRPSTNNSAGSSNFKARMESQIPRAAPTPAKRTVSAPMQTITASSSSTSSGPAKAKSPGSSIPHSQSAVTSTPKRGRTKPPTATPIKKPKPSTVTSPQKRSKSTAGIRSTPREVVEYPEMPDVPGGMADAIPSWTQPKRAGNWDDVVLPAVARKLGLEDQYEEASGNSPPPRRASQDIIPPQPGTFGIDPNKRRRRYDPETGQPLSPDQTAQEEDLSPDADEAKTSNETAVPPQSASPSVSNDKTKNNMNGSTQPKHKRYSKPPSPPPFAHYQRPNTEIKFDNMNMERLQVEEEDSGGCCKCIIM